MDRIEIIQKLIDTTGAKRYLEIGVQHGFCFLEIRAPRKIGVDPAFNLNWKYVLKKYLLNPYNLFNRYFKCESDQFFQSRQEWLKKNKLDIVFIDGLHTYEQSLKDVYNSLKHLNEGGFIVMHDCNPPSESAALPVNSFDEFLSKKKPEWKREWCGDVWKTIVHLKKHHSELDVFVVDCDYGIGIISPNKQMLNVNPVLTDSEIETLNYSVIQNNKSEAINLKSPGYFNNYIEKL